MTGLRRVASIACLLAAPFVVAESGCASRGPDLAARMAAAKSIYESVGFTAFGAPAMGAVADGVEGKVPLPLKEGCYQVVTFPGDGLKGIEVSLLDAAGKPVGEIKKQEGSVSIKHCVSEAATFNVVVKSAGGAGSFLTQPYASADKPPTKGPDEGPPPDCVGDDCGEPVVTDGAGDPCSNGLDLAAGASIKGNNTGKGFAQRASCAAAEGPSTVYRLHVEGRHKLVLDLSAKFDAVLGLFRADHNDGYLCDSGREVECSDDAEGQQTKSHVEAVVDTGDYGVIVAGYEADHKGEFELKTRLEDAPSLEAVCATARAVNPPGQKTTELVGAEGSNFHPTCASTAGSEALFKLDLKARSRVRMGMRASTGGDSSISVRKRCDDPASELVCAKDWHLDGISWTGLMDAGAYTVIASTTDATHSSSVDLTFDRSDALGSGVDGDGCKDGKALPIGAQTTLDTFAAKSDVRVSCAADASADVVYKLDVKAKSRLFVSTLEDEGHHVLAVQKACGDPKGELACEPTSTSKGLDVTVDPGSYYLVVKGKGADDFGRVKLSAKLRELAPAVAACKAAPKLVAGTPVSDTTAGAIDRFASEKCGGAVGSQQSGDKVYQFTLKEKSKVNLTLKGGTFYNAILSLRTDCGDPTRNELVCSNYYSKQLDQTLDAGTYYVVVDGYGAKAEGTFTLELTTKPAK